MTSTTLALPRWPRELDGLRVAVLADLHVGSPWNGVDNLARIVATQRATCGVASNPPSASSTACTHGKVAMSAIE